MDRDSPYAEGVILILIIHGRNDILNTLGFWENKAKQDQRFSTRQRQIGKATVRAMDKINQKWKQFWFREDNKSPKLFYFSEWKQISQTKEAVVHQNFGAR